MRPTHLCGWLVALAATGLLLSCTNPGKLRIRRTRDSQEVGGYHVKSLTGFRDGEKLHSQLVLADNKGTLIMLMNFQIGVPTKLESGRYTWNRTDVMETTEGGITEKPGSVVFQGGQGSPPSLGGTFELLGKDVDVGLYEVHVPATPMDPSDKTPFRMP